MHNRSSFLGEYLRRQIFFSIKGPQIMDLPRAGNFYYELMDIIVSRHSIDRVSHEEKNPIPGSACANKLTGKNKLELSALSVFGMKEGQSLHRWL